MDQEENKLDKPQFEKRCPSISEVLGYTSVVVVLLALAIPFELKYGYSANLFNVITFSTDKNDFLFNFIRHIGLFSPSKNESKLKIFSKDDLTQFTGEDNEKPIYLAFLGKVYDVSSGKEHYGVGGAYHFFAGKDASRAYVTGDFVGAGLTDDITGLPATQYSGLKGWISTFEKKYPCIGKVDGFFYDSAGREIDGVRIYEEGLVEAVKHEKEEEADSVKFPGCNSMFKAGLGHEVWCSRNSGGVQRGWEGVPRKYFKPGQKNFRCACVKEEFVSDPSFKEFDGCSVEATRCKITDE